MARCWLVFPSDESAQSDSPRLYFGGLMLALFGTSLPVAQVAPASTGNITPVVDFVSTASSIQARNPTNHHLPVIHLASSPARNLTAAPTSQPVPSVFNRLRFFLASLASSLIPPEYIIGVYTIPGQTQLTRMPCGAWCTAIARVMFYHSRSVPSKQVTQPRNAVQCNLQQWLLCS